VGKYINIASRCAGFINKRFGGELGVMSDGDLTWLRVVKHGDIPEFTEAFNEAEKQLAASAIGQKLDGERETLIASREKIIESFDSRNYARALRAVMQLTDVANAYVNHYKPWELAKQETDDAKARLHGVCTTALNMFKVLSTYLYPVVPEVVSKVSKFLNSEITTFESLELDLHPGHLITEYAHLIVRLDPKQIEDMVEANKESMQTSQTHSEQRHAEHQQNEAKAQASEESFISIDDFTKVDLRIARISNAEHVEGAEKLLKLTLDIGEEKPRQVFAGIKSAYDPETLKGRLTVMVANLAPRKMKFGLSEGMVLAASDERGGPFILSPDIGAQPGMRVK
jgi:methionyl-tRNA synthetase